METIKINKKMMEVINKIKELAAKYEELTGRKLGVTGEIGEFTVCKILKLNLIKNPRTAGYDAIDQNGKKVQIKTRRREDGKVPIKTGRLSKFSNHKFDYALFCTLDKNYGVFEIYKATYKKLKPIIEKEQNEKRGITIQSFLRVAKRVYPKKEK